MFIAKELGTWICFVIAVVVLCGVGCQRSPANTTVSAPKPPPAAIAPLPVTLKVKQRTTTVVPGSGEKISLTVDDITRGQVIVSLVADGGGVLVGPRSMPQGDEAGFAVGEQNYVLKLSELSNALVGEDFATFVITAAAAGGPLSEAEKIERLIAAVAALDKAVFVRNNEEHSAAEAAAHLRTKREAAGDAIKTAAAFIEKAASKSSVSGEVYQIRFADGRTVPAGEFLRGELAKLEGRNSDQR